MILLERDAGLGEPKFHHSKAAANLPVHPRLIKPVDSRLRGNDGIHAARQPSSFPRRRESTGWDRGVEGRMSRHLRAVSPILDCPNTYAPAGKGRPIEAPAFVRRAFRRDVGVVSGLPDYDLGMLQGLQPVPTGRLFESRGFGVRRDAKRAGEERGHQPRLESSNAIPMRLRVLLAMDDGPQHRSYLSLFRNAG